MKLLILPLMLILVACGKPQSVTQVVQASEVCVDPSLSSDVRMVQFPDGTSHKSAVSSCSSGCSRYSDVDNAKLFVTFCQP